MAVGAVGSVGQTDWFLGAVFPHTAHLGTRHGGQQVATVIRDGLRVALFGCDSLRRERSGATSTRSRGLCGAG